MPSGRGQPPAARAIVEALGLEAGTSGHYETRGSYAPVLNAVAHWNALGGR